MKRLILLSLLALAGCASTQPRPHPPKTVLILGNRTTPAHCACCAEAVKWKAYAETLETQLGIPHEKEPE